MMKIGYACMCLKEPSASMRTCTMKYASEGKMHEIIKSNLTNLMDVLQYNKSMGIMMFRISSDLIPFGSSPVNTIPWQTIYQAELKAIGSYIKANQMRVSLHPGQYTLINSPRLEVLERAIMDLRYHCDILDSMELDASHKMVIHIGGIYGDKEASIKRFINEYERLSEAIKKRLVIENDDHYYHIEDVLKIGKQLSIPVVFDNLHHAILHPDEYCTDYEWLMKAKETWRPIDGTQKMHYSEQDPNKRVGAHALSISSKAFHTFLKSIYQRDDLDMMIEVKDKNLSAIKAVQILWFHPNLQIQQWYQYQYLIMERDYNVYKWLDERIPTLDVLTFYEKMETVLYLEPSKSLQIGVLYHLLDYLEDVITAKEYQQLLVWVKRFADDTASISRLKKMIYRIASRYRIERILQSYYFL